LALGGREIPKLHDFRTFARASTICNNPTPIKIVRINLQRQIISLLAGSVHAIQSLLLDVQTLNRHRERALKRAQVEPELNHLAIVVLLELNHIAVQE
jgi:hypothetical protein